MSNTAPLTCARCGAVIAPGAHYCASCGLDISSSQGGVTTIRVESPLVAVRTDALLQALREATLGEYEVLGELGRGGMATVYLAHDIALDRKVAIKVMSPALMAGEGMAERFKREARTAGQLSHPHIIPIYAVREHGDLLYFVMKFIAGRSLDSIIREVGALPIPMVQTILQQVGSALGYAHRRGVIHRDVKPANVMLDSEGWAVVTDFGIAKVSETQGLTLTGATVGTPSYMSPEQCAAKELTGASDQYSLGVVAYEMLSGRLPFAAESVMAVMYAHFNEPPPPVTLARPDCPPALADAVMRMLEKEPAHRFPSMEAATAAVGTGPLAPDDPVRTQMITLAARGESLRLLERVSTPVSQPSVAYGAGIGTSGGRPQIATLMIAPARVTVATDESVQLRATAKSRSGKTIGTLPVSWASTNTDIAHVAANGLVSAVAPGTVTITASSGNTSATAVVTVVASRRPGRRLALLGGGAALAVIAAALLLFRPFGGRAPDAAVPDSQPRVRRDTVSSTAVLPTPPSALESTAARPTAPADSQVRPPRGGSVVPASRPLPDSGESTVATALASARDARAQALAAGAGAADLAAGDSEVQQAEALRRPGHRAEAFALLRRAEALFSAAESTATVRRRTPPETAKAVATQPPPTAPAPQPPDPAPVRAAIVSYGRALERRDAAALRQAYPGMSARQLQQWQDFFRNARDVRATIEPSEITFDEGGDRATASVQCTLRFQNTSLSRRDEQPCDFHARLRRQGTGWVLDAIQ